MGLTSDNLAGCKDGCGIKWTLSTESFVNGCGKQGTCRCTAGIEYCRLVAGWHRRTAKANSGNVWPVSTPSGYSGAQLRADFRILALNPDSAPTYRYDGDATLLGYSRAEFLNQLGVRMVGKLKFNERLTAIRVSKIPPLILCKSPGPPNTRGRRFLMAN